MQNKSMLSKNDKIFLKVIFFLLNLMMIGMVIGISTRFGSVIYTLTMIGTIGWVMFSTPTIFNGWGKAICEYQKLMHKR